MQDLLLPELVLLVVASNILGVGLKKLEMVKDKYITIFLLIFCLVFSAILLGFNDPTSYLQGILAWGTAIGIHQTTKQITKSE